MLSDLARKFYAEKIVTIKSLALTNVSATTPQTVAVFTVPRNLVLINGCAGYITGDASGTGVSLVVANAAGTAIFTSGVSALGTGPSGGTLGTPVAVPVSKDDVLLIKVLAVNATDDFASGVDITLVFEPPKVED